MLTIAESIITGCEYAKDISEKLSRETLAANILDMDRFPDQSQINMLLNRMDESSIDQLRGTRHALFMQQSHSAFSVEDVIVDFDQSGLIANGKTYEFSKKGYFPKKNNQHGYQVSAAFIGKYSETIELFLDSGNVHCSSRFDGLLKSAAKKLRERLKNGKLIILADSGYGSLENIERMKLLGCMSFHVNLITESLSSKL